MQITDREICAYLIRKEGGEVVINRNGEIWQWLTDEWINVGTRDAIEHEILQRKESRCG